MGTPSGDIDRARMGSSPPSPQRTLREVAIAPMFRPRSTAFQMSRAACLLDEQLPPGEHAVVWDGTNERGNAISSGVYFVRLTAGAHEMKQKIHLVK